MSRGVVRAAALAAVLLAAVPAQACRGVWVCPDELAALPTEGPAWAAMRHWADRPLLQPNLANQNDNADIQTLAMALVFGRTGDGRYRDLALQQIEAALGTERSGRVLALGRNLPGYVIAADIVGLPEPLDRRFRDWLRAVLDEPLDGETLRGIHERRPNNWGTHAGAARLAVARYLGDDAEVERVAGLLRAWLGDRAARHRFKFGDVSWQADPGNPTGINPVGAMREGQSIDGVLPDDQRRCCKTFTWPPPKENYVYEALQGILAQAVMLQRAGHPDVWLWGDRAILRAFRWLYEVADFPATGDDTWEIPLVNQAYGTHFAAPVPSGPGKNVGFTDWTGLPRPGASNAHPSSGG